MYVTVVVPTGKSDPEACEEVNDATPTLSLAVGAVHVAVAVDEFCGVDTVIFSGIPLITGLVTSFTVTVKLAVPVFPAASFAV